MLKLFALSIEVKRSEFTEIELNSIYYGRQAQIFKHV